MNENAAGGGPRGADLSTRLRVVALIAVITGVILLAAAAFVLAYAGIHAIALAAGVSPTLAKLYPLIFDAMLVVASAAALALRGRGWWTKFYAWLTIVVLLAAVSAADAAHAMGVSLPRRPTAAGVAVTPWVLLLLAFGLWLALLRHLRSSRSGGRGAGTGTSPARRDPRRRRRPVSGLPVSPPPGRRRQAAAARQSGRPPVSGRRPGRPAPGPSPARLARRARRQTGCPGRRPPRTARLPRRRCPATLAARQARPGTTRLVAPGAAQLVQPATAQRVAPEAARLVTPGSSPAGRGRGRPAGRASRRRPGQRYRQPSAVGDFVDRRGPEQDHRRPARQGIRARCP